MKIKSALWVHHVRLSSYTSCSTIWRNDSFGHEHPALLITKFPLSRLQGSIAPPPLLAGSIDPFPFLFVCLSNPLLWWAHKNARCISAPWCEASFTLILLGKFCLRFKLFKICDGFYKIWIVFFRQRRYYWWKKSYWFSWILAGLANDFFSLYCN